MDTDRETVVFFSFTHYMPSLCFGSINVFQIANKASESEIETERETEKSEAKDFSSVNLKSQ